MSKFIFSAIVSALVIAMMAFGVDFEIIVVSFLAYILAQTIKD